MPPDIAVQSASGTPLREDPFLVDDLPLDDGLRPTLDRLADRIANIVGSAPLTTPVHVSGDWRSEKTTLLRGIWRKLANAAITQDGTPTIMFEAWHHEWPGAVGALDRYDDADARLRRHGV